MNSVDFCYWLQGHFELNPEDQLSPKQLEIIKQHLNLVFLHEIDPLRESETTTPTSILNDAHNGGHTNDPLYRC